MPGLAEQIAEFGFGGGLSQKEDSWLSSTGFGTLKNCVQDKTGALQKHPGYSRFPTNIRNGDSNIAVTGPLMDLTPTIRAPKLIKRGDQVAAVANGLLFAKTDNWQLQGRTSPWVCEQRTVCQANGARQDACSAGEWAYTAFEVLTGGISVVATYLPSNTTVTLFSGGNLATTGLSEPRIVGVDLAGTALLFYMSGGNGFFNVVTPDGVGVPQNIPTNLKPGYDVTSDPASGQVWTVWFTATVITSDYFLFSGGTLVTHATTNQSSLSTCIACTITADAPNNRLAFLWVEYLSAGGGNFNMAVRGISRSLDYSTVYWTVRTIWQQAVAEPITATHAIPCLGVAFSSTDGYFVVFTDRQNNQVIGHWTSLTGVVEGGGAPAGPGDVTAPVVWLRSRPVWDGKRMFFLVDQGQNFYDDPSVRRGHLVLGIEPRSSAGKATPQALRFGVLANLSYLTAGPLDPNNSAASIARISRPYQDIVSGAWHFQSFEIGGQAATLQFICDYTLIADDRVGTFAELGKATYITGAVLSQWDGTRVCEATFPFDPSSPGTLTPVAGGSMAVGRYTYAITYGRMTATGEVVRSRPSLTSAQDIVAGPNQAMVVSSFHPGPTNLANQDNQRVAFVEFWRAQVNTTSPLFLAGRVFVNFFSTAPISFTDSTASYAGKEQLYSDGTNGEIANTPSPSPLSLCQWRNRLWMTDGEQLFYTKEAAATRGAEWSQAFFVMSRGAPERLSAVAPLGETLMAFAEDSTSYVYGDGPGANGDGSTLVGPMPAITELGCTQPAGIAQLPDGLLVPTRRGLHYLDGKREYHYVGAAIESTLTAYPRVRCARHIGSTNLVWISLATADLATGVAVVFDTHHRTFSTRFESGDVPGTATVHCSTIEVNGFHSWAVEGGFVYDQGIDYRVNGARYAQQVETPWFKTNGTSGELRVRRFITLMKRLGTSKLQIDIGYDYSDTYHFSITLDDSQLAAMEDAADTLKLRIPFPRQRCQAYRIRFTEAPPATSSGGFRFIALRMVTCLRPGTGKLLSKRNSLSAFTKS